MPLDELARRYADELYQRRQEEILEQSKTRIAEIRRKYSRNYPVRSGFEVQELVGAAIERTSRLAEARAETLIAAYSKAGLPFDDEALRAVTAEVSQLCVNSTTREINVINRSVHQIFGDSIPNGLQSSAAGEIERGIGTANARIGRDLRIRHYEIALSGRQIQRIYAAGVGKRWDAFISHASEDKQEFVDPLAEALSRSGLSIWYDKTALHVGDSLRRAIDDGLANSRFGIVVLSHNFFAKQWPQQELDGLFARQVEGLKVILPVWHRIDAEEVRRYSPMLAGLFGANSGHGLEQVVKQLREAMGLV